MTTGLLVDQALWQRGGLGDGSVGDDASLHCRAKDLVSARAEGIDEIL